MKALTLHKHLTLYLNNRYIEPLVSQGSHFALQDVAVNPAKCRKFLSRSIAAQTINSPKWFIQSNETFCNTNWKSDKSTLKQHVTSFVLTEVSSGCRP
jgi:hypothetical protein